MSDNIKVSEVSEILRMQLEGITSAVQFDEVGTVLQVSDGVVRIYGLNNAEANELLVFISIASPTILTSTACGSDQWTYGFRSARIFRTIAKSFLIVRSPFWARV